MRCYIILLVSTLLLTSLLSPTVLASSIPVPENPSSPPGISQAAGAQEYYVSPGGRDPGDCSGGTQSSPWKTWAKAEQCVPAGSTVYFMAGSYSTIFSGSNRSRITFKGSADRPIHIRPALGHEGKVFFNRFIEIYGQHGVISGININASSSYTAVSIYGASNVRLEGNKIHDSSTYDCVHIYKDSRSISLINNEVYNCGYNNSRYTGQGDAVDATGGISLTYRGNQVHHALNGFQIKGGSRNVLVENNRIHDVGTAIFGASMGAGSDPSPQLGHPDMHNPATAVENRYQAETVVVKNNLIYNTSNYDALSAKGWMNYHIYNNTIFNHRGSTAMYISGAYWEFFDTTALAYCQTHACSPCTNYRGTKACVQILLPSKNGNVFNNIVHTFANRAITVERGNTTGLTSANNVYFTSGINADTAGRFAVNGTSYSLRKFQSLGYETRSNVVNPQLRNVSNVSNPDLRLNPGSPVIDKGMLIASVIADFAGTRRPQGAVHEPGAYEFAGSGISGLDEKVFLPLVLD